MRSRSGVARTRARIAVTGACIHGGAIPRTTPRGMPITIPHASPANVLLTFAGLACGIVIGIPLGVVRGMAPPWMHAPVTAILALVRATPLLLLILWLYLFIEVVLSLRLSPTWIGAIALGLYSATWISDAFLAGTRAVPADQIRAARALGFGSLGVARHVVVP